MIEICSIIILLIVLFFVLKKNKKLKEEQKLTIEELWENKKSKYVDELYKLNTEKNKLIENYNTVQESLKQEKRKIELEIEEKKNFNNSLLKIREEELNRLIEEKRKEKMESLTLQLEKEYNEKVRQHDQDLLNYTSVQEDIRQKLSNEIKQIEKELEDYRLRRESINEAILREKEIQEKEFFYKLDIPQCDREDIVVLRGIAPQLKNKESLNKLIYEVFIRRPLTELIKRITGGRSISGIYKITYIKTGEAYIGRTTDIQTRWQNHIKTACGLDGAARTTFHNRLEKDGIWNYTFEILEEVPKDRLSEREKFYIDLYGTDTQLNSKKGG